MKGKSSSRVKAVEVMERSSKSKAESHVSSAYIRSLVKHLSSSSKSADQTPNPKSSTLTFEEQLDKTRSPPPQPKKQVRRRLHTSRPYQERLLNMAEARREIVNALKLHRASMKQANEPLPPPLTNLIPHPNPDIYEPNLAYPSLDWSYPTLTPLDNFNLTLPNYQPLGLNLDFQGFNNIDTPLYNSSTNKDLTPIQPLSPCSSSSFYSPLCANMEHGDVKMHVAMDEKEMEEIRSIGEKHDIEWNDTINLMTSVWWSSFLEADPAGGNGFHAFDDYYLQDASLPCLDLGEMERMDEGWLSQTGSGDI